MKWINLKPGPRLAIRVGVILSLLISVHIFAADSIVSAPATNIPRNDFRGILEFAGKQQPTDSEMPYVRGAVFTYYWSQLAPAPDKFDFARIDRDMKPWVDAGKVVVLRVSSAGWAKWSSAGKQGLPQWIYDQGLPSVHELDGAEIPEYWNPIYLRELNKLVGAFARRYDGNTNIAFIEIGVGDGGETLADTYEGNTNRLALWQGTGYTDKLWFQTVNDIVQIYKAHFKKTPLALMIDSTFLGKSHVMKMQQVSEWAVSQGLWLQHNGLKRDSKYKEPWLSSTHVLEQYLSAKHNGYPLMDDLQQIVKYNARWGLIYRDDLMNPTNREALEWVDSQRAKQ